MFDLPWDVVLYALIAGIAASLACGLGVLPLAMRGWDPIRHRGMGFAVAGGLMFSASVYNLILPGMDLDGDNRWSLPDVATTIVGLLVGAGFLAFVEYYLHGDDHEQAPAPEADSPGSLPWGTVRRPTTPEVRAQSAKPDSPFSAWGGRVGLLVFIAMTFHSIPEGVAVGVGFTSDAVNIAEVEADANEHGVPDAATSLGSTSDHHGPTDLGLTLALAIGLHNIPEGLAVAIPMRSAGVSLWRCFWAAVFTSLPQPIAAVPAVLLAWLFQPLMPALMAFAAGAMIFLIVLELIPEALETESPTRIAWGFMFGFCGMLLVQVVL